MIWRIIPDASLADREALVVEFPGWSQATIRAYCQPVACDVRTKSMPKMSVPTGKI